MNPLPGRVVPVLAHAMWVRGSQHLAACEQIEWIALPVSDHAPGPFHHRHQGQKIMRCHIRLGHEFHMAG